MERGGEGWGGREGEGWGGRGRLHRIPEERREALQDLPKVEHTNYTLQWGQDWSFSGSALQVFLTPTEAEAGTFFFLLWLSRPLHLCSPSTSVPALVKATTSLLWQEHFQISFPKCANTFSTGLHPFITFWSWLSQFLFYVTLTVPVRIPAQSIPLPSINVPDCKTQFRLSDSLLHGKDILDLTGHWSTRAPKSPFFIPCLFSFSPLQLLYS